MKFFSLLALLFSANIACAQANTSLSNISSVLLSADLIFGTTSGDHYIQTNGSDNLTVQAGGGLNLSAGSSVQIHAGGDGVMLLATSNTSDIDVVAGGSIVNFATGGSVYNFGASVQLMSEEGTQLTNGSSQPECDGSRQGSLFVVAGGTGVADELQVCLKLANDSFAWRSVNF